MPAFACQAADYSGKRVRRGTDRHAAPEVVRGAQCQLGSRGEHSPKVTSAPHFRPIVSQKRPVPRVPSGGAWHSAYLGDLMPEASSAKGPAPSGPRLQDGSRGFRLLLADGNVLLLEALEDVLGSYGHIVVGTAENGRRAVALAQERHPEVAVLGATMPILGGLDAAREIVRALPATRVLLVTGSADEDALLEALWIGVRGIVLMAQGIKGLLRAIAEVSAGGISVSPVFGSVVELLAARDRSQRVQLTPRETEVLGLRAAGKTTKQTAAALDVSVRTVEFHWHHVMKKLRIGDMAGLVRYALRHGLIAP